MFRRIDLKTWARKPYFDHYMHTSRCTFSMTANLEIGRLLPRLRKGDKGLHAAMLHVLSTCVNRHEEFRLDVDAEEKLGVWETLHPAYTVFHQEDETFSNLWTSYQLDFTSFHEAYRRDVEAFGQVRAVYAKPGMPRNVFPVSNLPWTHFTALNLNLYGDGTSLTPAFTMGKYQRRPDGVFLPLAVQVHHAVCDGFHVGRLFEEAQVLLDHPEIWMR